MHSLPVPEELRQVALEVLPVALERPRVLARPELGVDPQA